MNDDLTWLARNVHEWDLPDDWYLFRDASSARGYVFNSTAPAFLLSSGYTKQQWAARRAELQNKPSWDDAPEWATHLAQSLHRGKWDWFPQKPEPLDVPGLWAHDCSMVQGRFCEEAAEGEVLGDWRDTLEERPQELSNYRKALLVLEAGWPSLTHTTHELNKRGLLLCPEQEAGRSIGRSGVGPNEPRKLIRHLILEGVLDVDLRNAPCDCGRVDPAGCKCSEPKNVGVATPEEDEDVTRWPRGRYVPGPMSNDRCRCVSQPLVAENQDGQSEPVTAASILQSGLSHMQDRAATYDKPEGERSMAATVRAFKAVTGGHEVDSEERGWLFMVLLKLVRSQQGGYRADNYEDAAAYCGLQGEAAASERSE